MINVKLNDENASMCFVGKISLNFMNPGPVEIDLNELSEAELNQIVYNVRKEVLLVDDKKELLKKTKKLPASSDKFKTSAEKPIEQPKFEEHKDLIQQDELDLRKVLRETVPIIMQKVEQMSVGQVRRLIEQEVQLKNRKKLVTYLKDIVRDHEQSVTNKLGNGDMNINDTKINKKHTGLAKEYWNNISEIVETDVEQVVLNPAEE